MSFVTTAIRGVMSLEKSSASLPAAGSFLEREEKAMKFSGEFEASVQVNSMNGVAIEQASAIVIFYDPSRIRAVAKEMLRLANVVEKRANRQRICDLISEKSEA